MSTLGDPPRDPPEPEDPFLAEDPAAREREARRREREQRRRQRAAAPSEDRPASRGPGLGTRVEGALSRLRERRRERPERGAEARLPLRPLFWVLAAGAVLLAWFLISLFQPFKGDGEGKVVVDVPKGASAGAIADLLDEKGVISSATMFEIRLTLAGRRSDVLPGTYTLANDMSYSSAMDTLTTPPSERTITVTIPEGLSREEIASIVTDAGIDGSYERATRSSRDIDLAKYGAAGADSLEGFLFPATYELKAGADAEDLVKEQLAAFEQNFKKVDLDYARSKNLAPYDVLTIASMIEREVMVPDERKLVGAVIYNRLADGEPLGIDATIRYATGNYDQPLTESELAIDSPYNTRENAGLPPGPIGNPGLDSLEAAANPAKVDYRYYVVKPGTCGEHEFVTTQEEFDAAVARYNSAREAAGGESPTDCPE